MDQIDSAYEPMLKSDVKYRFVIDIGTKVMEIEAWADFGRGGK